MIKKRDLIYLLKLNIMRAFLLLIGIFLFFNTKGQISQGGNPSEIIQLKSVQVPVVRMPLLNNSRLLEMIRAERSGPVQLKPFRFAHTFDVDYSPENSGAWYRTVSGLHCWKLKIHSRGAKSINVIFENFELPENARLFIYNDKENHILGAFTKDNNKVSGKFAVSPVAGNEIVIHYEVTEEHRNKIPFRVKSVNHDFVGILDRNERRPLGEVAGSCNIDINCALGLEYKELKNAVCRMIVDGREVCSGSLINNSAEDQKPYIISAAHCYDKWEYAETSIYTFNYESPFCAPLDGDPSNSISGALMKAQYDSLDFALVELSVIPPPDFRPYYAGWDRSSNIPDSTLSIHHPQGDIKKIAMDNDPPEISDFASTNGYTKNGFLKVIRWDKGVTEVGSSGGPLFNTHGQLIGTLTGGVASCSNPIRDYFQRISLSWDYKPDSSKQLKYWLDPVKSNLEVLDGKQFNEGETLCGAFTNLNDNDDYELVTLLKSDQFSGYWGGTNSVGVSEFVERFSIPGNEQLSGISIGVGKIHTNQEQSSSEVVINVYNGSEFPEELIYSKNVSINELVDGVMNYIGFDQALQTSDTFYVGFALNNMQPLDTFVAYQSLRPPNTDNYFFFRQDDVWKDFEEVNFGYKSMSNVFEIVACNIDDFTIDTPMIDNPAEILAFPNPARDIIIVEAGSEFTTKDVSVLNLLGQTVNVQVQKTSNYRANLDLSGNVPGVYFIRFRLGEKYAVQKISYVPW